MTDDELEDKAIEIASDWYGRNCKNLYKLRGNIKKLLKNGYSVDEINLMFRYDELNDDGEIIDETKRKN